MARKGRFPFWCDWKAITEERVFRYWMNHFKPREVKVLREPRIEGKQIWLEVETEVGIIGMICLTRVDEPPHKWKSGSGIFFRDPS